MISFFRVGKIISLHGIKGEVKVYPTTSDAKRYDRLKVVYLSKDEDKSDSSFDIKLSITGIKYVKEMPIISFEGYKSIEDSTKLIGYSIYIKREDAITLKENEYYMPDIIGLDAYEGDRFLGTISDAMTAKNNNILCIEKDKKQILVPMAIDFIEKIDIANKKIYLKNIEGLA